MKWDIAALIGVLLFPYVYLMVRFASVGYFRSKFEYHRMLMSSLERKDNFSGKSHE